MNHFEFYGLPVSFFLDEADLRQRFLRNSKASHPDFFTLESDLKQAEMLELSTRNNQAYQTLSDFDLRMQYILDINGMLGDSAKNVLPQDFLLQVMEINEAVMELAFEPDKTLLEEAQQQVSRLENALFEEVRPVLEQFQPTSDDAEYLEPVKDFFLKKRYLGRILEKLHNFASASNEDEF